MLSRSQFPASTYAPNKMLRHHAFFETLGSVSREEGLWRSTFAGLAVLRLVDQTDDSGDVTAAPPWSVLHTTREAIAALSTGDPARGILTRVVELIDSGRRISAEVGDQLMAYGRSLDVEGRWGLAAEVFRTVAARFPAPSQMRLAIESCTALGSAARHIGDWDGSARGYAEAQHLADTIGDRAASLTVQVGVAGTLMSRGNLQAADRDLDAVLEEAHATSLEHVEALALHAKASVAHSRGDYQRAVHLAYRSLELTTNRSSRERILADIAAAYAGLGMRDAARDGYSIVALTSPHQWVRWQATLNLMELAIGDGEKEAFVDYMRLTESAALDPRLRAYFLFFKALGHDRFEMGAAHEMFDSAAQFASEHGFHQIEFEIEAAAERSRANTPTDFPPAIEDRPLSGDEKVRSIAEALALLREAATSGAAGESG